MIRPFTAMCVLLAGASGLYLYTEKHRTTLLDEQISRIVSDTQHVREHTAMLRAEWTLLNQPDRLQSLAGRFLPHLQPMAPSQFVRMAALADRLGAIGTAAPAPLQAPVAALPPMAAADPPGGSGRTPALVAASPADRHGRPLLAPIQVMARSLAAPSLAAPSLEIATDEPRTGMEEADPAAPRARSPAFSPSFSPAVSRTSPAARSRPRPAALPPQTRQSRTRAALQRVASLYQPQPLANPRATQAAFADGVPARLLEQPSRALGGGHSALGFAHAALSAPVPVQDGR